MIEAFGARDSAVRVHRRHGLAHHPGNALWLDRLHLEHDLFPIHRRSGAHAHGLKAALSRTRPAAHRTKPLIPR
jgi:hypothetical protein